MRPGDSGRQTGELESSQEAGEMKSGGEVEVGTGESHM